MASLPLSTTGWRAKIESVIFQIGIARFHQLPLCAEPLQVYMSDDKVRLYESASSALESLRKSGLIARRPVSSPAAWVGGTWQ